MDQRKHLLAGIVQPGIDSVVNEPETAAVDVLVLVLVLPRVLSDRSGSMTRSRSRSKCRSRCGCAGRGARGAPLSSFGEGQSGLLG